MESFLTSANISERGRARRKFGVISILNLLNRAGANRVLFTTSTAAPEIAFIPRASAACHLVNVGALAMRAYGRITPALPFKELNRRRFIPTGSGQVLDHVRFRKLRMLLVIHGTIFHDRVGHWLGYRPQFALSTYSRKLFALDSICPTPSCRIGA